MVIRTHTVSDIGVSKVALLGIGLLSATLLTAVQWLVGGYVPRHDNVMTLVLTKLDYGSATLAGLPAVQLDRLQSVLNAAASSEVRPCVITAQETALAASARACHLPVGSFCLSMSAQHGAALPPRPAPTGEQRWLPAASTLVVVGQARCSSHRTRDHRWPCVQFNCSSCVEQFANGSAVF